MDTFSTQNATRTRQTDDSITLVGLHQGQEVAFRRHGGCATIVGTVAAVDINEKTVTLICEASDGAILMTLKTDSGVFKEAQPLSREETREYAEEVARRYVGKNGTIRCASLDDDTEHVGEVRDVTPSFVIQENSPGNATLFRLKDLRKSEQEAWQMMVGQNLSISRSALGTIAIAEVEIEGKGKGAREKDKLRERGRGSPNLTR